MPSSLLFPGFVPELLFSASRRHAIKSWDELQQCSQTELALEYEAAFAAAKEAIAENDQQKTDELLNYCDKILCLRLPLRDAYSASLALR